MKRRFFAIFAIFSLAIWFIVLAGWIRSRAHADVVWFQFARKFVILKLDRSMFVVVVVHDWDSSDPTSWSWIDLRSANMPDDPQLVLTSGTSQLTQTNLAGIQVTTGTAVKVIFRDEKPLTTPKPARVVGVPWWMILSLPGIVPLLWLFLFIRRRRRLVIRARNGLCLNCGYDLRASTGRCPECGTTISPQPTEEAPA